MPRIDRRNASRYWSNRGLTGLNLLLADFTTHEYAPHRHDGFVIAATEEGGANIRSRNEIIESRPSVLFVSNPEETQSAWMGRSRRWRYRSIYLSDPALSQVIRNLGIDQTPRFAASALADARLCTAFLSLHYALADGNDRFKAEELSAEFFGHLFSRYGVRNESADDPIAVDRRRLTHVLEYMRTSFPDNLDLAGLAGMAGLSVFQLIVLFRRVTGLTPHAYLIQLRLNAARHQLASGALLAEAAAANGFYDQSALTKHFKRAYGITPGQFAAAVQPGQSVGR